MRLHICYVVIYLLNIIVCFKRINKSFENFKVFTFKSNLSLWNHFKFSHLELFLSVSTESFQSFVKICWLSVNSDSTIFCFYIFNILHLLQAIVQSIASASSPAKTITPFLSNMYETEPEAPMLPPFFTKGSTYVSSCTVNV